MPTEKRFINAAEILAAPDLKVEEIDIPEWNTWVRVRELSAADREWLQQQYADGKEVGLRAKVAVRALVDEAGKRLYDDQEVQMLGDKNFAALERISSVALRLSALNQGAVEDAVKNSADAPSVAS